MGRLQNIHHPRTDPDHCDCYECVGSEYDYHEGHRYVKNNSKHHTFHETCGECGRRKTEYLDLGRKGYWTCWWCHYRTADQGELRE